MPERTWKDGYRAALALFILKRGEPITDPINYYGYMDYDAWRHIRECAWLMPDVPVIEEETFSQFENTFTDASQHQAVLLRHVDCKCGLLTDRTVGYKGTLGDILTGILDD